MSNRNLAGTKFYNNGIISKQFHENEVPEGWVKGRLFTPEWRAKIAKSLTGKKHAPERVEKMRQTKLAQHVHFHHTEETKRKISITRRKRYGYYVVYTEQE